MMFHEAMDMHKQQYFEGKNKYKKVDEYIFPYNFLYANDEFIKVELPLELMETQETDKERVDKYIDIIREFGKMKPSWISIGKKLKNGEIIRHWHLKFYVLDGNHRTEACKYLGHKTIEAILPKSHYIFFKELENDKDS